MGNSWETHCSALMFVGVMACACGPTITCPNRSSRKRSRRWRTSTILVLPHNVHPLYLPHGAQPLHAPRKAAHPALASSPLSNPCASAAHRRHARLGIPRPRGHRGRHRVPLVRAPRWRGGRARQGILRLGPPPSNFERHLCARFVFSFWRSACLSRTLF
ncbi:hypothetical protein K438DRAFT_967590 [Mycena galopus ATCC 62051]|nr:hypothetical protein K438DRAFT_967590 [Mycena galopus ATCC 62051]